MDASEGFLSALAQARARYRAELPGRLCDIEARFALASSGWSEDEREWLVRSLHSIAGSAGVFGLAEVGRAARATELALRKMRTAADLRSDGEMQRALRELRRTVASTTGS